MPPSSSSPTTTTRDAYGRTFLHTSLLSSSSSSASSSSSNKNNDDSAILHLLQTQPQLASICDEWNQSPLHHAIYFARSVTIVNELIYHTTIDDNGERRQEEEVGGDNERCYGKNRCCSVVEWRDKDGDTPLHVFYRLWGRSVMKWCCRQRRNLRNHRTSQHISESLMTINEGDDESTLSSTKMMITSEYGDERSIMEVYKTFISLCRARWKDKQRQYEKQQQRQLSQHRRRPRQETAKKEGHDVEEKKNGGRNEMDSSFCPLIASLDDRECPYSFVRLVIELRPWLAWSSRSSSSLGRMIQQHYLPLHACLVMINDDCNDTSSLCDNNNNNNNGNVIQCRQQHLLGNDHNATNDNNNILLFERRQQGHEYLRRAAKRRTRWYCNDDRKALDYNFHHWITTTTTAHTDNDNEMMSSSSYFSKKQKQQQQRYGSVINKISRAIIDLISIYPFAASLPDDQRYSYRLPLHTALMTNHRMFDGNDNNCYNLWWDDDNDNDDYNGITHDGDSDDNNSNSSGNRSLIRALYKASPRALSTRDLATHLYPFMLAATLVDCNDGRVIVDQVRKQQQKQQQQQQQQGRMTICFQLLLENPQLVRQGNK